MPDKVHITKTGFQPMEWDGEVGQYVEKPIKEVLAILRVNCHIDAGVTVWDIFRAVDQHPKLKEFIGCWAWCDVDAFHREAAIDPEKPCDLDYIEISKYFSWHDAPKYDLFDGGENLDCSGRGKPQGETHRDPSPDGTISWGIDFTPVNELRHLPVKLAPKMKIQKEGDGQGTPWLENVGEAECYYTLLDVLGELYYEISFHGSPKDRDERSAELRQAVDEIQSGRATLVPYEPDKEVIQ